MNANTEVGTVLVVEDEEDLADLYAGWLRQRWAVRVAYSGEDALTVVDDDVDLVLLDREMPGLNGTETLQRIRDRDIDCVVSMLTAVEPELDIVDLPFDDYLCKPVGEAELLDAVDQLLVRNTYHEGIREEFAVASKIAVLEERYSNAELQCHDEYQQLVEEMDRTRDDLHHQIANFQNPADAFKDLP